MTQTTMDRVYGCLAGGAIGDALGAVVETWSYHRIREEYGKLEEFRRYDMPYSEGAPGSVTDDTTLRHYLAFAIAEHGSRITPDEYAAVLTEYLDSDRVWVTEEIMLTKLWAGMNPWDTGLGSVPAAVATMAIGPVGIINAGNPRQAYQDGFNIAFMNQSGPERDAAATHAAGVAAAMAPGSTVDSVLDAMLRHSSETVYRGMTLALDIADRSDDAEEFVERFYDQLLDWRWIGAGWDTEQYYEGEIFSGSSLEVLPAAVGILSLVGDDPNRLIVEAANFGRDCDTIASVCGGLGGAMHGAGELRRDWIEQVETANVDLFAEFGDPEEADFRAMSRRLVTALENERDRAAERAASLDRLLGDEPE